MVVQVGDWMERERDVLDRLVLVDWVWVGYVCVRARAGET